MLNIILLVLVFTLPPSLMDRRDEITGLMMEKQEEFLAQCYKWQKPVKCDRVLKRAKVTIIDDFIFPVDGAPRGTAHGQFQGVRRITESFYNRISTNDLNDCNDSPITRTREEMYQLSNRNPYWRDNPYSYFCADTNSLLGSVVHERCHPFRREFGHVEGFEDCQPIK